MGKFITTIAIAIVALFTVSTAEARVVAKIDVSSQVMEVFVDGQLEYSWKVSTGKTGFETPTGDYKPLAMRVVHYSKEYDLTPMPYSIFFREGGFAIHGTPAVERLGQPASHGCVRLDPYAAKELYKLVKMHGQKETRIVIDN